MHDLSICCFIPMSSRKPPLPPRSLSVVSSQTDLVDNESPRTIADRIARLKLDQAAPFTSPKVAPPSLRRHDSKTVTNGDIERKILSRVDVEISKLSRTPEDLAKALARRPPPPPIKKPKPTVLQPQHSPEDSAPPLPPRRPPRLESIELTSPSQTRAQHALPNEPLEQQPSCLECWDFSYIDAHAERFPRHSVTSLNDLAHDLTEPFTREIDRARAVFTWLHHNIAYDVDSFFSGNLQNCSPEMTLSSGLAVCDGYSGLFKSLMERVGVQVHKVTGHGKGVGYQTTDPDQPAPQYSGNHAWNCALLDGDWYLIDSCWGAGALEGTKYKKRFAPMWFTSSAQEFGRTHFPEDPSYQLIPDESGGPISWEDYIMEPARPTMFTDFYQLQLWPAALQPSTSTIYSGTRVVFSVYKRCEHMSVAALDNFIYMVSFGNERAPLQLNQEGGWSVEVFIPQGTEGVSLCYVSTINGEDAKGKEVGVFKKALGRSAMTFVGLARWTVL